MFDGVFRVSGGGGPSHGSGALTDGIDEEAVMEWFIEEIADHVPINGGTTTESREVQVSATTM